MKKRNAARLILLDPEGRILLTQIRPNAVIQDIKEPYWITPGGKIEEGETPYQAALRELQEETGIHNAEINEIPLWQQEFILNWYNEEHLIHETFFLATLKTLPTLLLDGLTAEEHKLFLTHRWWSKDELARTTAIIFPKDLHARLLAI